MNEPMKITDEMKERKEKKISEMIDRVNKDIKRALHELYKILARMGWNHKRRRERPHDNL